MKVHQLIEKLQALNPDALVVSPAFDHSYRQICCAGETQADYCQGHFSEYWDDAGYEPQGKIIKVVVLE